MAAASRAAPIDAAKTAIFAAAKSRVSAKAWPAMKSDMVKPMPASALAVASRGSAMIASNSMSRPSRTLGAMTKPAFAIARSCGETCHDLPAPPLPLCFVPLIKSRN